jgi:hypothetical protein
MRIFIYPASCYQPVIVIKKRGSQSDHNKRLPLCLVESDKGRQVEPPVDPTDALFMSIAATVKTFSPYH